MPAATRPSRIPDGAAIHADPEQLANPTKEDSAMQWIDPAYCDIRLGFEVTAYVYVR